LDRGDTKRFEFQRFNAVPHFSRCASIVLTRVFEVGKTTIVLYLKVVNTVDQYPEAIEKMIENNDVSLRKVLTRAQAYSATASVKRRHFLR